MRIAITGAGGLLGGAVLRRLLDEGHEALALSRSLEDAIDFEVVPWDAADPWQVTAEPLRHADVLIHSAAHIPRDHRDAAEALRCIEVNAIGTLNLQRAAEHAGVGRFIYVSGANVLSPRAEMVREDDPVGCEHAPYYLGSKLLGEVYVRAALARGMDGLIVRPSSIYGPGMRTGVLQTFARSLMDGEPIRLMDGGCFRADYVWREDVASVLVAAVTGSHRGVVNLGSGQSTTVSEVAHLLCDVLGADPELIEVEAPRGATEARGFGPVDISRAGDWFDFHPKALRDGLSLWFGAVRD
jgi:UDP-glucose 4-epimerase